MGLPADACTGSTKNQNPDWLLYVSFALFGIVKLITLQEYKAKIMAKEKIRCSWCLKDDLYKAYHDEEWGTPLHDDDKLFELLCLEGAQAGLSWYTILNKRENYRKAFDWFDAKKMAKYGDKKIEALLQDAGIVRNRLKVNAFVQNAKTYLAIQKEFGSFDKYIWQFVGGKPIVNKVKGLGDVPTKTEISDAMSKDLLKRGFKFVGSTICYAFMQASGMVNDHADNCWKKK
jgi:DNA-3-methyladenine glycosylase I